MAINPYLEAVTTAIKTALVDACKDVESHPGRFTEAELKRISLSRRAVRIAVEDILETQVSPMKRVSYRLLMAAFVICSDRDGPDRSESAIELVEKVISVLPRNRWNSDDYKPVLESTISAQNLYSGEIEKRGIAMWAITWNQTITGNL
jgi:hypothetical protein